MPQKGGIANETIHLSFAADWSKEVNPLLTWNKKDDPNFKQHMYNRGVMNLGSIGYDLPDDELEKERKHRLSLGAHYVNQKRTNQTRQKILDAINTIKANGEKVTRKRICNVTGLGQSTLNRYKSIINDHK